MNKLSFAACALLPGTAMAAAHFFPWRRLFGRDLHRLEAYGIGTAAIVGTAAMAISNSDGDRNEHVALLLTAAASAGVATLAACTLDYVVGLKVDLQEERIYGQVVDHLQPQRN